MKKTINALLALPGAAPVLGAKIIGRVIGQVANGFGKDDQLVYELAIYKAIAAKYPKDTITMMKMFDTMKNNANTESNSVPADELEGMSEEERDLWTSTDLSDRDQLLASRAELTSLFVNAPTDTKHWLDLPTIAQWSLLNAVETALPDKVAMYKGWADTDRIMGKTGTNAMRLQADAEAAIPVVHKTITEFLANKNVAADLTADRKAGIAVPIRAAA